MIYRNLIRPVLFRCDPEWSHDTAIRFGEHLQRVPGLVSFLAAHCAATDPVLNCTVADMDFQNPLGLAAGFDKSGRVVSLMAALGFGHIEIGSISCHPSAGNPKPRLWRLPDDAATLVHYGLPNDGATVVAARSKVWQSTTPVGVNLVNTNRGQEAVCSADEILDDYVSSARLLQHRASYFMLNLSCPNTLDGHQFFADQAHLVELLSRLRQQGIAKPLFLKINPDLQDRQLAEYVKTASEFEHVRGLMLNLSPRFREGLRSPSRLWNGRPGAISGAPICQWMDQRVATLYRMIDPSRHQIVAAGGIRTAEDAYRRIRLGASLVQVYTALIYEGPFLVRSLLKPLAALARGDGLTRIGDAVGADVSR